MQIFVNIPSIRKTISLTVNDTDTINVVKSKIHAIEGVPHDLNRLWFSKGWLKEERTLFDYNIKEGSTLALVENLLEENEIKIQVCTLTGSKTDLQISNWATVKNVKTLIRKRQGPVDRQRFTYKGQELINSYLLAFYNISNDSVIHLVHRLKGGAGAITVKYFKTLVIDCIQSVRDIKEKIEELEGYPPALQQLTLDGRMLDDDYIFDEPINELALEIVTDSGQNSSYSTS